MWGQPLEHLLEMRLRFQKQEEGPENCPYIFPYWEKYELKQEAQFPLLGAAGNIRGCVLWKYFLCSIL